MKDRTYASYSFDAAWSWAERAQGWLERSEAELLYRLAAEAGRRGRVVELGSYCGRSSIILAAGVAAASASPLVCVDTFAGSAEHMQGQGYFDPSTVIDGAVDTYGLFLRNLEQACLSDAVEIIRRSSVEAAQAFSAPVGLLFVDADHSYAGVRADICAWCPKVVEGGWIVLHDVGDWSGPTRAAADLLDGGFRRYAQAGTALALHKPVSST
jgi:MMP 1-O-methyltransferase